MGGSRQALFQAVLDRPAEDAPRLLFAELCDAQGDPYGAFIRAQLARTEALRHGSDEEARRFGEQADQIRREHGSPVWTNGIERLVDHVQFVRGFVEMVIVDARRYLDYIDELYRHAPLRHLVLTDVGDLASEVARDPHLAQVAWLSIAGKAPIGDAGLAAIAASPHAHALQVLEVGWQGIGMAGLEALCASQTLRSLVYVNLAGNRPENLDLEEGYGTDWVTGRIVDVDSTPRPLGRELEAKYGDLPWLHGPSRLRHYPPETDEI